MSDYRQINTVADNKIPDVITTDTYALEIYTFYRAGILTGSDKNGTFYPTNDIKRSEVAATSAACMTKQPARLSHFRKNASFPLLWRIRFDRMRLLFQYAPCLIGKLDIRNAFLAIPCSQKEAIVRTFSMICNILGRILHCWRALHVI